MRIIGFSNASGQPFMAVPVRVLVPWMTRLRNSLGHLTHVTHLTHLTHVTPLLPEDRVAGTAQRPVAACTTTASNDSVFAPRLEAPALPASPASSKASPCKRLRVVRESDSAISPDCAGRMVISGRMADVCAELDRMALRATTTPHK